MLRTVGDAVPFSSVNAMPLLDATSMLPAGRTLTQVLVAKASSLQELKVCERAFGQIPHQSVVVIDVGPCFIIVIQVHECCSLSLLWR